MSNILVINAGSSSVKYQLIDPESGRRLAAGLVERIGEAEGVVSHRDTSSAVEGAPVEEFERRQPVPDHTAAFVAMVGAFERAGTPLDSLGIVAVGHRVVQGGSRFSRPTRIDDETAAAILQLGELAPLHNPGQYQAIVAARALFPTVPHVAVFDTAFHQTMPEPAYAYALDAEVAARHGIRRYGFHGTSHQVVSRRAAEFLERPLESMRQIVLHLGNGASVCAIDGGRSVDTSMGFTPLEGLVMGTRSGDFDPGALLHLLRNGYTVDELDQLLNKRSGLLGLSGSGDFRDVSEAALLGDASAQLALDVYAHRIRHYLGAYLVELGGADAIVFTAGVGENNAAIRAEVCRGLEWFGIAVDPQRNACDGAERGAARRISTDASRVEVLVVPTDEEAEIALQTRDLVG